MGVKGFSKMFEGVPSTLKSLEKQTLAVDASLEIYRSALGMASVRGLTDATGRSTLHISVILANLIAYRLAGVKTIWVFDGHANQLKAQELEERRAKRTAAAKKLADLDAADLLFSDSDSDDEVAQAQAQEIQKQEKIAFTLQDWMVMDIKHMLNLMGVPWIESQPGVEGECLAAQLTQAGIADAVLSSDADALLFGAKALIKKNPKTKAYVKYELEKVLEEADLTRNQLIKLGIVLGCDMYKDKQKKLFFRIGPKSAIRKIKSGALAKAFEDEEVKLAIDHFEAACEIPPIPECEAFDVAKARQLVDWLVEAKNFNRSRITKQLRKIVHEFE